MVYEDASTSKSPDNPLARLRTVTRSREELPVRIAEEPDRIFHTLATIDVAEKLHSARN